MRKSWSGTVEDLMTWESQVKAKGVVPADEQSALSAVQAGQGRARARPRTRVRFP